MTLNDGLTTPSRNSNPLEKLTAPKAGSTIGSKKILTRGRVFSGVIVAILAGSLLHVAKSTTSENHPEVGEPQQNNEGIQEIVVDKGREDDVIAQKVLQVLGEIQYSPPTNIKYGADGESQKEVNPFKEFHKKPDCIDYPELDSLLDSIAGGEKKSANIIALPCHPGSDILQGTEFTMIRREDEFEIVPGKAVGPVGNIKRDNAGLYPSSISDGPEIVVTEPESSTQVDESGAGEDTRMTIPTPKPSSEIMRRGQAIPIPIAKDQDALAIFQKRGAKNNTR